MIYFILGIIVGILVRDIKTKTVLYVDRLAKDHESKGQAQFIESKSMREKFDEAVDVEDLLE